MSCKLIELSELEKSFYKTSTVSAHEPHAGSPERPKKIKIRECGDLRYWWDNECDSTCEQMDSAG